MWTRQEVKQQAKDFLRKNYWKAFLVCLIATLLTGGGNTGTNTNNNNNTNNTPMFNFENNDFNMNVFDDFNVDEFYEFNDFEDPLEFSTNTPIFNFITRGFRSPLFNVAGGMILVMIALVIILIITVGYAIEVGRSRFFLHGFNGNLSIGKLFSTFNGQEYFPILKTMFLKNLYIFLWGLLLIIPGIIKSYEYRFVPYILAEKPDLTANEIISKSREMTSGHKFDIFILDLSFIGWYFLGGLLFGIGIFFVDPYVEATNARLYTILSYNDYNPTGELAYEL